MKKMFKTICVLVVIALLVSFAGCSGSDGALTGSSGGQPGSSEGQGDTSSGGTQSGGTQSGDTLTLSLGHVLTEDHFYHIGYLRWAELINERTNGRIVVEIFPNGVLGGERELTEAVQIGTLDLTMPLAAVMGNFTDAMRIFDLPYVFQSREEAWRVLDSDIGQEMLDSLENIGLIGLAFWENGFRHVHTKDVEAHLPADLTGLKIRTMENATHMETFRSWGANPIAMAWGEVYTAVQQGLVNGVENPLTPMYQSRIHEVTRYITLTQHCYMPAPLFISTSAWSKLSEEEQRIVREVSVEVGAYQRQLSAEFDVEILQKFIDEGVTIIDDIDKGAWREAAQPVYDSYIQEYGDGLLKRIEVMRG